MRVQSGSLDANSYASSVFQKREVSKAVFRTNKSKRDTNKKSVLLEISRDMVRDS